MTCGNDQKVLHTVTAIKQILVQNTAGACEENFLGDDRVEYWLYPLRKNHVPKLEDILAYACQLSDDYIWHHQQFNLVRKNKPQVHFHGSCHFEDNIEDEWFIISLLVEITKKFPLAARVTDADGEILLIEAADYLPKWVDPQTIQNRVFIKSGKVHLISPNHYPDCSSTSSAVFDAIDVVLSETPKSSSSSSSNHHASNNNAQSSHHQTSPLTTGKPTLANKSFQSCIAQRLHGYHNNNRSRIKEFRHRANCMLPEKLAKIIRQKPNSIAAAVRAFYLRDPFDMKSCREMRHFALSSPNEQLKRTTVTFTKHLYAMLKQQKFVPDRRSALQLPSPNSPEYKAWELGIKLIYGYEILCCRSRETSAAAAATNHRKQPQQPVNGIASNLNPSNEKWTKFNDSLKKNGFYREELEGSKLYQELEGKARKFYAESVANSQSMQNIDHGMEIIQLLESQQSSTSNLNSKNQQSNLSSLLSSENDDQNQNCPDDDDSWLNVGPDDLNSPLSTTLISQKRAAQNNNVQDPMANSSGTTNGGISATIDSDDDDNIVDGNNGGVVMNENGGGGGGGKLSVPPSVTNTNSNTNASRKKRKKKRKQQQQTVINGGQPPPRSAGVGGDGIQTESDLTNKVSQFLTKGSGEAVGGAEPPPSSYNNSSSAADKKDSLKPKISSSGIADLNLTGASGDEELIDSEDSMESYGDEELDIDLNEQELKELAEFGEKMQEYMSLMDSELSGSTMGQSFVKKTAANPGSSEESAVNPSSSAELNGSGDGDEDTNELVNGLASSSSTVTVGSSDSKLGSASATSAAEGKHQQRKMKPAFQNLRRDEKANKSPSPGADSIDLEDDDFNAVDIDRNLVANILEGYSGEQAQGGGASTALLRSLSINNGRGMMGGGDSVELDSDDDHPIM